MATSVSNLILCAFGLLRRHAGAAAVEFHQGECELENRNDNLDSMISCVDCMVDGEARRGIHLGRGGCGCACRKNENPICVITRRIRRAIFVLVKEYAKCDGWNEAGRA